MTVPSSLNERQIADAQLDHLRLKMAKIRRQLDSEVEAVRETAGDLVDWKHYAKAYPWLFVGVAVALGFAVVPRRVEVIRPDPDTLAELAKSNRLVVTEKSETRERSSWADTAFRLLSHSLFRAGTSYLAQHFGARAGEEAAEAETADA